jgi:drug/metabolite transporter (DMT)-like permease
MSSRMSPTRMSFGQARRAAAQRFSALPAPLRGGAWMAVAMGCFASMDGLLRHVTVELHPFQTVFLRSASGLVILLPFIVRAGFSVFRTTRLRLHLARGVSGVVGFTSWVFAISLIPLAEATALSFTMPLFATLFSAVFLRESVSRRRWFAVAAGFLGVLIVLRPGMAAIHPGALVALWTAVVMATTAMLTKRLSATESPLTVVAYVTVFISIATFLLSLPVWRWPSTEALAFGFATGALGSLAQICMVRAYASADASLIAPFDFLRLPFATVIGVVVFTQVPDAWTFLGAAVIVGANAVSLRRHRPSA